MEMEGSNKESMFLDHCQGYIQAAVVEIAGDYWVSKC